MENKKFQAIHFNLVDVIYGVVFSYGFNLFDQVHGTVGYLRYFFVYVMLIIDWIYFHYSQDASDYKKEVLVLDIAMIFVFSRLLYSSTHQTNAFFLLLFLLFLLYVVWDLLNKKAATIYNWTYSFVGDLTASLIFLIIWIVLLLGLIPNSLFINIAIIVIYLLAISTWFKKKPKS